VMFMDSTLDFGPKVLAVAAAGAAWLIYRLSKAAGGRSKETKLRGPPSPSWIFGVTRHITMDNSSAIYEEWSEKYGVAFEIPTVMGSRRTILFDPRAVTHYFNKDTFGYVHSADRKKFIKQLAGESLFWEEGETHHRQRRALGTAFSSAAIRNLTPIFYDSAYKLKAAWDSVIGASGEAVIDSRIWMDHVAMDSIGKAGFEYDFATLEGKHSEVAESYNALDIAAHTGMTLVIAVLAGMMPFLQEIPTKKFKLVKKMHDSMEDVARRLLERDGKDKDLADFSGSDKSIIGALIKAERAKGTFTLTEEEVVNQIKLLILGGYETTAIALTWIVIELARNPEKQQRLRDEVNKHATDPTYDDFINGLPYLDGVIREALRLHPPLLETIRVAAEDDIVPLSTPITTATGEKVSSIHVPKGTPVVVPIQAIGCSKAIWGPDAKEFKPERWLNNREGLPAKAKEIQGYHHILTFVDGPRICLGRVFAFTEMKAVLSVMIRSYRLSLRDGPDTEYEMYRTVLTRPRIPGSKEFAVPVRIQRIED